MVMLFLFLSHLAINQQPKKDRQLLSVPILIHSVSSDIIIIAITSKIDESSTPGECFIEDWKYAGLLKPSCIKPAISTIETKLVLKKLGELSQSDVSSMRVILKEILDI